VNIGAYSGGLLLSNIKGFGAQH